MISRRTFLYITGGATVASFPLPSKIMSTQPSEVDHIILGCKDLDAGMVYMERLCGYRAAIGGSHPGRGTHNALLKLGYRSYLEILAPDPAQPELVWHKEVAALDSPMLIGWAVPVKNIEQYATHLRGRGIACTGPMAGSRTKPSGVTLRWKTLVLEDDQAGMLPFYIEWAADSAHPSNDAPGACILNRMVRTGQVIDSPAPGPEFHRVTLPNMSDAQLHVFIEGRFGEFELKSRAIPSEGWSKTGC
jgi:Glyoxalase-like domain